jgi:hypothetical protein
LATQSESKLGGFEINPLLNAQPFLPLQTFRVSRQNFGKEERNLKMDEKAGAQNMEEEPATPAPEDDEGQIDGCDVPIKDETPDEDLPITEGGVA